MGAFTTPLDFDPHYFRQVILKDPLLYFYVDVWVCVSVSPVWPWRASHTPGARVIGNHEPPDMGAGNSIPILTPEPSLQSPDSFLKWTYSIAFVYVTQRQCSKNEINVISSHPGSKRKHASRELHLQGVL